MAKSGINNTPTSVITGDIAISPAARSYISGFSLNLLGAYSTSAQVTGNVYAADDSAPTPAMLNMAIIDMQNAYADAGGRAGPNFLEMGAGIISGQTLVPGLYKWNTGVSISGDVTLNGGPNDVWIFQISGGLTLTTSARILLTGGAQAKNVFWYSTLNGNAVTIGLSAHLEGIVLTSLGGITLNTGATVTGRLFSYTAVNLYQNTVIPPPQFKSIPGLGNNGDAIAYDSIVNLKDGKAQIYINAKQGEQVKVQVFNMKNILVREWNVKGNPQKYLEWDLHDKNGKIVPQGLYGVFVKGDGWEKQLKVYLKGW